MLDLPDRFINWLMSGFFESLQDDLKRYADRLAENTMAGKEDDIALYLRMITETRGIIADMSDENMEIKDFVHLILEKYGQLK